MKFNTTDEARMIAATDTAPAADFSTSTDLAPDRTLLPIRQVAELFGRKPRTIRWWIVEGRLPVVRIGRTPFVPAEAIDRMIAEAFDERI